MASEHHHGHNYPDDESSTFLRGRLQLQWCGKRTCSYLRHLFLICMHRIRARVGIVRGKMNVTKLAPLLALASLAFMFMEFGTTSSSSGMMMMHSDYNSMGGGGGSSSMNTASSIVALPESSIKGYQARSQVPIPIEYANFVELAEFADAVTMVRAHLQKLMMQQQHQQQHPPHHGRRLDEDDNADGNDEDNPQLNKQVEVSKHCCGKNGG